MVRHPNRGRAALLGIAAALGFGLAVCIGLAACGTADTGTRSSKIAEPTNEPSPHVGTFVTHAIPPGQAIRGDGDADNPGDIDGNGDRDIDDGDKDRPTQQSYIYPDADDRATLHFGHAAGGRDRRDVAGVVTRLYVAAAAGDGAAACAAMLPRVARSAVETYGAGSNGPAGLRSAKTCAQLMSRLFAEHRSELSEPIAVLAVRIQGDEARAVIASRRMPASEEWLQRDGGSWKTVGLIGTPLS